MAVPMSNGAASEPSSSSEQASSQAHPKRDVFTSSLGAIAATLGSAVGLGNIWKFPALTGQNGGAAFVLLYLICVALVGLPVLVSELLIGRRAGANAISSFKTLAPKRPWYLIGVGGAIASVLIMGFYTDVAGWVYAYVFKAATGALAVPADQTASIFAKLIASPAQTLLWQWIVLAVTTGIVMAGVSKGIEAVTKRLMPILFVLLLICDVRALTLPGASAGLAFLFKPDFSKLGAGAILTAMGLAFFKLSLGMGAMTTYGSYMSKKDNIPATAAKVALADTVVSLLAGIAIFPAVFAFGYQPAAGPSLLFMTIPSVFGSMPFGQVFTFLFFVLTAVAATGAMISLLEVPIAYLCEEKKWTRAKAGLTTALVIAVMGVPATLSTSTLSHVTVFGKTFFDLYDFLSSNIIMPVGGIAIALFMGWSWKKAHVLQAASNDGRVNNHSLVNLMVVFLRYLAPAAIAIVLLNGLGFIKL